MCLGKDRVRADELSSDEKGQTHFQCEEAMRTCDTSSELLSVPDIPRRRRK